MPTIKLDDGHGLIPPVSVLNGIGEKVDSFILRTVPAAPAKHLRYSYSLMSQWNHLVRSSLEFGLLRAALCADFSEFAERISPSSRSLITVLFDQQL